MAAAKKVGTPTHSSRSSTATGTRPIDDAGQRQHQGDAVEIGPLMRGAAGRAGASRIAAPISRSSREAQGKCPGVRLSLVGPGRGVPSLVNCISHALNYKSPTCPRMPGATQAWPRLSPKCSTC